MPVFDWTRTELARMRPDGSTVLAYTQEAVDAINPENMFESIAGDMNGTVMPGWEPERMEKVKELFEMYKRYCEKNYLKISNISWRELCRYVTNTTLTWQFIRDDPAWSVFGLPRIIINKTNILRLMSMVDNPHNRCDILLRILWNNLKNDLPI